MRAFLIALLFAFATLLPASAAPAPFPQAPTFHLPPQPSRPARPIPTERIDDFSSDIAVAPNGDLTVKETIAVHSDRRAIVHGIVRKFPTRYQNRQGQFVHVAFNVREVQRDGKSEPYSVRSAYGDNYVRIGDGDVTIARGEHTYLIVYETDRQIGFFPEFDELYWNVTGTEWAFPILHAEAIVHLPEGARMVGHSEYTGPFGARGGRASAEDRGTRVRFFTTASLNREEGLTFALDFNKGVVAPPSPVRKLLYLMRDNAMTAAAVGGLLALGAYFFGAWLQFGRDPARGVIVPLFAPPRNLSAASVRFIHRMDYDRKCFAAALVAMAVKGYLKIEDEAGTYVLTRTGSGEAALAGPERAVARPLFDWGNKIGLENSNHELVARAITTLQSALKREDEGTYFNSNRSWVLGGVGILAASVAAAAWFAESGTSQVFVIGWILTWVAILVGALHLLGGTWRTILVLVGPRLVLAGGILLYGTFSLIKPSAFLAELAIDVPWFALTALLGQACLAVAFYHLLKAPTVAGAKIRDEIEGFRMFLDTAEKDRLEKLHPPAVTPEVFEKFLPYAIALDAENTWSKRFEAEAARAGLETSQTYVPNWYVGSSLGRLGYSGIFSGIGSSIGSASASAALAPGGSGGGYGGGGGGFSGGGGGGGW